MSDERPSKSERKRAAHAAQTLGERLIALRDAELARLPLPEELAGAIRAARGIRARSGLARQRQFIGKLMRQIDLEPIIAALAQGTDAAARATEASRRIEAWRQRLLRESEAGLDALAAWRPLDAATRRQLRQLCAEYLDSTRSDAQRATANRALFRRLRELFAAPPADAKMP